jgi:hypothetical protein
MESGYIVSTGELVAIGLKEIGKNIPVLGSVLAVRDAVFGTIEMNRVKKTLEGIERRVGSLEEAMRTRERAQTVVYGCEQARSDILFEGKAEQYAGVVSFLATADADLNQVVEVLDSLRKLSVDDLRILYHFKTGGTISEVKRVAEFAGWNEHEMYAMNQFSSEAPEIREWRRNTERLFPGFMRLQGMGVLYLSDDLSVRGGRIPPDIGALGAQFRSFAHLTEAGMRLLAALPGESFN